jgi:hypothetical protein
VTPAVGRLLGFVLLVHGLGLRLDSTWQETALTLIVGGGALLAWALVAEASVWGGGER